MIENIINQQEIKESNDITQIQLPDTSIRDGLYINNTTNDNYDSINWRLFDTENTENPDGVEIQETEIDTIRTHFYWNQEKSYIRCFTVRNGCLDYRRSETLIGQLSSLIGSSEKAFDNFD